MLNVLFLFTPVIIKIYFLFEGAVPTQNLLPHHGSIMNQSVQELKRKAERGERARKRIRKSIVEDLLQLSPIPSIENLLGISDHFKNDVTDDLPEDFNSNNATKASQSQPKDNETSVKPKVQKVDRSVQVHNFSHRTGFNCTF